MLTVGQKSYDHNVVLNNWIHHPKIYKKLKETVPSSPFLYTSYVVRNFIFLFDAGKVCNHSGGSVPMLFDALTQNIAALIEKSTKILNPKLKYVL